jgi:hypothetical protein
MGAQGALFDVFRLQLALQHAPDFELRLVGRAGGGALQPTFAKKRERSRDRELKDIRPDTGRVLVVVDLLLFTRYSAESASQHRKFLALETFSHPFPTIVPPLKKLNHVHLAIPPGVEPPVRKAPHSVPQNHVQRFGASLPPLFQASHGKAGVQPQPNP